jgi:hypothetical protein
LDRGGFVALLFLDGIAGATGAAVGQLRLMLSLVWLLRDDLAC